MIAFALVGSRLRVSYRTPLTGCAYDDGTGGASGLHRWGVRMGFPTRLMEGPLAEVREALPAPEGNVALTMGDDPWFDPDDEEAPAALQSLLDWVEDGNTLIVVTGKPQALPVRFRSRVLAGRVYEAESDQPAGPPDPSALLAERDVDPRAETVTVPVRDAGSLAVEADGPRWTAAPDGTTAPAGDDWRLAGDARGGVLYRIPLGSGACYVLLDPFAWSNAGLDVGENAKVLAAILGRELGEGGALAMDEHRHGHGRAESFLTYLLGLPGASAFLSLALAWGVLYYYGRNVRIRPAEARKGRERRTAQEYIDAVAQLHERARAAPLAVEAAAARLRQVARSSSVVVPQIEAKLAEADDFVAAGGRPANPRAAIGLVAELAQLRKKFYGSRTIS